LTRQHPISYSGARAGTAPLSRRGPTRPPHGIEIWILHLAYSRACPAIVDGTAYFADGNGYLTAVDLKARQTSWTFQTNGSMTSSPAVADGVVYVGSNDGYLYALK
jgi:outer membrane protein assembly factor BamB